MIAQGQMTMIGTTTYLCIKVEDGFAYLKNILHEQGRAKKVKVEECPYIKNDELIVPQKKEVQRPRTRSKLNLTKLMKESTDLQISRSAKNFMMEWVETAIANQIANAERNAIRLGHSRITAGHIHWLETNSEHEGFWKEHEEYIKG
jgi:histone H3/H4